MFDDVEDLYGDLLGVWGRWTTWIDRSFDQVRPQHDWGRSGGACCGFARLLPTNWFQRWELLILKSWPFDLRTALIKHYPASLGQLWHAKGSLRSGCCWCRRSLHGG